ncbi:amino acid permease-associated region [Microbacterium esteraromaticum]|uniref:Amino acid permease-associated region n=1 Tax=Microbacterium esteraromaticum TaxID=57043 RepID=A0A1R4J8H7_9MICO|nr:APC family permease [Microbacterium esteraromaticum]SJN28204.1 amino acid permease-associated region [Microbacterium esteraromaticum]
MSATTDPSVGTRKKLGVASITVMIIAASAPLTVIAGGATTAFSVTGSDAVPIGYVVLALALAIFAVGYAAMSRFVTNAGAFYAYAAQGLGRPFGVGASLIALVAYNCMQVGIYGMFGFQVSMLLTEKLGWDVPWWVPVLVCIAIVGVMGVNRVDLSAKVLGVIVLLEFAVVLIFDITAFANPAEGFTAQPISPAALFTPGIGAVLVFGIAAFMGFESGAIYGEEAKDPKRTVARATFSAVLIIGAFYALSSWALALAIGTEKITGGGITPDEAGPPLFFDFIAQRIGVLFVDITSLLFITSLFAALVAFHNAVARYIFSLAREQVLPRQLSAVRNDHGAPWAGSLTQTVLAAVVIALFAIAGAGSELGPLFPVVTLFSWLTNTGALGLVLLMVVVAVAVIGFFRRDARGVGIGSRLIAPLVSVVVLLLVFVLILANFNVLLDQAEPDLTTFVLPALVIVPGFIGVAWGVWLRRAKPAVYARIGHGAEHPIEAPVTTR